MKIRIAARILSGLLTIFFLGSQDLCYSLFGGEREVLIFNHTRRHFYVTIDDDKENAVFLHARWTIHIYVPYGRHTVNWYMAEHEPHYLVGSQQIEVSEEHGATVVIESLNPLYYPDENDAATNKPAPSEIPPVLDRWSGEWVDGDYHMTVTASGTSWSGTFRADFKDGDTNHYDNNGRIFNAKVSGGEIEGNWDSDYSDSGKKGKRSGTFKIKLVPGKTPAEDRVTGVWLEVGDAMIQAQPDTAMKPGTKWPVNWKRKK